MRSVHNRRTAERRSGLTRGDERGRGAASCSTDARRLSYPPLFVDLFRLADVLRLAVLLFLTAALCLAGVSAARADDLSDIPAAFVAVGIGARPMGSAGAVAAARLGSESLFWNPAGLTTPGGSTEFAVTHGEQMGLVPYSAASAAHRLGSGVTLGVGLIHSGDDVLTETTLLLGAAKEVAVAPWCAGRSIGVGIAARGRRASFGNNDSIEGQVTGSATGFGFDVGALVPLTDSVTLGVAGRDMLNSLTWDSSVSGSYGENVPAGLTIGLRVAPHGAFSIEMDIEKSLHLDSPDRVLVGAEVALWDVAHIRGGYRRALPPGDLEEYTVGAGATVDAGSVRLGVDFAYVFGQLENTMRFSLSAEL